MNTCPLPVNQLYVHASGRVYPCNFLQENPEFALGHIQEQTLAEIWRGAPARALREQHLSTPPKTCLDNQGRFLCHKVSGRRNFNQDGRLKRLDVMLDSACNLTCIMCTNIYDPTGGLKGDFFWENNHATFAGLDELELVGGEPLISPHFYRLVDLVAPLNPGLEWRVTTNAHYELTGKLMGALNRMRLKKLSVSLDSLDAPTFEKIRQRSRHQVVLDNVRDLKRRLPVEINMVVQQLNCDEVVDVYRWTRAEGLGFYPIMLLQPDTHSLLKRPGQENKRWLLRLFDQNERLRSPELFFLGKKAMGNFGLRGDPEVALCYARQLENFGVPA